MNFLKNPPLVPCGFPVALWYPKCQQATWHRQMKICIRARVPPALEPHLPALPWHHDELGGEIRLSPCREGSWPQGRAPHCQRGMSRRAPFTAALARPPPQIPFPGIPHSRASPSSPPCGWGAGAHLGRAGGWQGPSGEDASALPPGPSRPQRALCCRSRARKEPLSGEEAARCWQHPAPLRLRCDGEMGTLREPGDPVLRGWRQKRGAYPQPLALSLPAPGVFVAWSPVRRGC